ncbi:MAG: hypothetical protein K2H35_06640, partial [Muribaculaceae bacterium]|nr:hypothetical protein [Muribaculaceae bacterium]
TDWGEDDFFTCSLPDDFLRLHTLWMADWPRPLSEDEPGDPQRLSLGERAPKWMLTRRLRPMLRLMPATEAASAQLRFGPTSARRPLMSAYVPAPHFDDAGNTLCALQPDALLPTVDMISKRIGDSLGYN